MTLAEVPEQYYTYEGRLASFQSAQPSSKRRASNAHTKAPKSVKWPHPSISAEAMAKAGFFHYPTQDSPDNCFCFLCLKAMDGWMEDDDPLKEHLKHSRDCGWAIVASINAGDKELSQEYPLDQRMIDARKATFTDRWPHETKKGWKCKVKQLVDAGWKYTPTPEYDDMATCTYCDLALDGWEPSDKPLDEHYKRSPDCTFFTLVNEHKSRSTPKKKGRKPRASKASRLSTQSTLTTTSEAPSFADTAAEEGDSVLTTATNATVISKVGKAKKGTTAKGRKAKAKKEEPTEVTPAPEPEDDDFSVKVDQPKAKRGRKRASEAMDESTLVATQVPPPKRRATRTRGSMAVQEHSLAPTPEQDLDTTANASEDIIVSKKGGRVRASTSRSMRNISSASTASKASLRVHAMDDEEIDKMLEADLDRPLTDEEDNVPAAATRRTSRLDKQASTAPVRKTTRGSKITKADHGMFGTQEMDIDDATIEAELDAMEVEESKPLPKAKGAKGKQARKPSAKQQAAAQKAAEVEAEAQMDVNIEAKVHEKIPQKQPVRGTRASTLSMKRSIVSTPENDDSGDETDASMASQSTVVRGAKGRRGSTLKNFKGEKRAASRNIEEIVHKPTDSFEEAAKKPAGKTKKVVHIEETKVREEIQHPEMSMSQDPPNHEPAAHVTKTKATKAAKGKSRALPEPLIEAKPEPTAAETPKRMTQPTPTPSPQSSDAENRPPSSKPSVIRPPTHEISRIPLAASTPTNTMSPSKRNILAGLQSSKLWTPVDLDEIFTSTPGVEKENFDILKEAGGKLRKGELTSPEKKMSVEEWIIHNATLAEEKLRSECEGMVGMFEREGGKAMRVLEGIECEE